MAKDAVVGFLAQVAHDAALGAEVDRALAPAADRFAALAAVAVAHGYQATADEIKSAIEAGPGANELSDTDLEKVAGGAASLTAAGLGSAGPQAAMVQTGVIGGRLHENIWGEAPPFKRG